MDLAELYKVVTDAMDVHISDPVDEAVEALHQVLSGELAEAYMLEHGYEQGVCSGFRFFKVVTEEDYLDELEEEDYLNELEDEEEFLEEE